MSTVLRTHTTDEVQGFMKALIGSDDRILGFTMIGSEAGEVMTAVQTAMLADLPYPRLRDAVIAHLTVAEGLDGSCRTFHLTREMQLLRNARMKTLSLAGATLAMLTAVLLARNGAPKFSSGITGAGIS